MLRVTLDEAISARISSRSYQKASNARSLMYLPSRFGLFHVDGAEQLSVLVPHTDQPARHIICSML